jgi:hypothetical protein
MKFTNYQINLFDSYIESKIYEIFPNTNNIDSHRLIISINDYQVLLSNKLNEKKFLFYVFIMYSYHSRILLTDNTFVGNDRNIKMFRLICNLP